MNTPFLKPLMERVEKVQKELPETFSALSDEQFNWQPVPERWSIGQCVDHMIMTNEEYFPALESVMNGTAKRNFWSSLPGWPRLCGWLMIASIQPEPKRKVKTVPIFEPSQSDIPKSRLEDFQKNCDALIQILNQFERYNLNKTIVISPATGLITFKLKDIAIILTNHLERHFAQAKNVTQTNGFPAYQKS